MNIEVFSGFSKRINSTKRPTTPRATLSVNLKEPTSVLSPVFLVHNYNLSDNYVKWGSRYYFIDDIEIIRNDFAAYHCSTDILATFKDAIGSDSEYVTRSSNAYSPYVQDGKYPAMAGVTVQNTLLSDLAFTTTGQGTYVIGIIAGSSSSQPARPVNYFALTELEFRVLMSELFSDTYLTASDITQELQKELVNPMQYIASCYWYPFDIDGGVSTPIYFGWWSANMQGKKLTENDRIQSTDQTFSLPGHPQSSRGMYLNDSPYTRHTLNCYGFGSIPLDPAPFTSGSAGAIEIDVDVFTGMGQMYVAKSGGRLFTVHSQVGVPIQISAASANLIGGALSALSGITSAFTTGNVVGAASGISNAIASAMPQVQSSGSNGSKVNFMQTPNIVTEFRSIVDEDNTTIGRPLCAVRTISTIPGYIQCENVDIDISGSPAEKSAVISYMEGGFFYE